jgi:hypothetical protein
MSDEALKVYNEPKTVLLRAWMKEEAAAMQT